MTLKIEKLIEILKKKNHVWKKYFAWRAVLTEGGEIVWLKMVERCIDLGFSEPFIDQNIKALFSGKCKLKEFYKYRLRSNP